MFQYSFYLHNYFNIETFELMKNGTRIAADEADKHG
jgi:hypothetical protein